MKQALRQSWAVLRKHSNLYVSHWFFTNGKVPVRTKKIGLLHWTVLPLQVYGQGRWEANARTFFYLKIICVVKYLAYLCIIYISCGNGENFLVCQIATRPTFWSLVNYFLWIASVKNVLRKFPWDLLFERINWTSVKLCPI